MDAILRISDPLAASSIPAIDEFAAEHKVPCVGAVGDGGLLGLSIDHVRAGKQAAPLADKILSGIPAGTIPVISADSSLRINYSMAQELGLTVPEGVLSLATEITR